MISASFGDTAGSARAGDGGSDLRWCAITTVALGPSKERLASEQVVEGAAERVHVRAQIDGLAERLLRRDVVRRAP